MARSMRQLQVDTRNLYAKIDELQSDNATLHDQCAVLTDAVWYGMVFVPILLSNNSIPSCNILIFSGNRLTTDTPCGPQIH